VLNEGEIVADGGVRGPVPRGRGRMQDATRWRIVRDGIEATIELLPVGEREIAHLLRMAHEAASSRLVLRTEAGGVWPTLY